MVECTDKNAMIEKLLNEMPECNGSFQDRTLYNTIDIQNWIEELNRFGTFGKTSNYLD